MFGKQIRDTLAKASLPLPPATDTLFLNPERPHRCLLDACDDNVVVVFLSLSAGHMMRPRHS